MSQTLENQDDELPDDYPRVKYQYNVIDVSFAMFKLNKEIGKVFIIIINYYITQGLNFFSFKEKDQT